MPKILIPYDDSGPALRAVKQVAATRDTMDKVQVVLLNVQHTDFFIERLVDGRKSEIERLEQPLREEGEKLLRKAAAVLEKAGVRCSSHVELGNPAPIIADYAKKYHCDMIVMGTRGLGSVESLILGSVATKVLHLARVPIMLVK